MCEQIASVPTMVQDGATWLFVDTGQATESHPDTKMITSIQAVVNRALDEGFRSATFYSLCTGLVKSFVDGSESADVSETRMIDAAAFTVPAGNYILQEVEKATPDRLKNRAGSKSRLRQLMRRGTK